MNSPSLQFHRWKISELFITQCKCSQYIFGSVCLSEYDHWSYCCGCIFVNLGYLALEENECFENYSSVFGSWYTNVPQKKLLLKKGYFELHSFYCLFANMLEIEVEKTWPYFLHIHDYFLCRSYYSDQSDSGTPFYLQYSPEETLWRSTDRSEIIFWWLCQLLGSEPTKLKPVGSVHILCTWYVCCLPRYFPHTS